MESAISFYTSLIPGSSISWTAPIPADTPSGPAGSVKVSAFSLGDQRYMAIEAGPLDRSTTAFPSSSNAKPRPKSIASGRR